MVLSGSAASYESWRIQAIAYPFPKLKSAWLDQSQRRLADRIDLSGERSGSSRDFLIRKEELT
jgi:hypothetical protein